jgi:hypothetical protein
MLGLLERLRETVLQTFDRKSALVRAQLSPAG